MHTRIDRREFLAAGAGTFAAMASSRVSFGARRPMTVAAVGDCIITRRVSRVRDQQFLDVVNLIRAADCALGNCEMVFGDARLLEPDPKGLDINLICEPFGADELAWVGLDMVGCANNHALDYGPAGLASTLQNLRRVGIETAGVGPTLARAAAPAYMDTAGGRVAMVNCTSNFTPWSVAENARADSNGRIGVNPVHLERNYYLEPALFEQLQRIRAALYNSVGAQAEQSPADKTLDFLGSHFQAGTTAVKYTANEADIKRVTEAVKIARRNAELVCVLAHEHGLWKPGDYFQSFARACIDAGADFFCAAGPHKMGAVEVYKGKPVCYSLGNFFFQFETVRQVPTEVYEAYGLAPDTADPSLSYDVMRKRDFEKDPAFWESIVPRLTFDGGRLVEFALYPIVLGKEDVRSARGLPRMATAPEASAIFNRLAKLCEPYGTTVNVENRRGLVRL